MCPDNKLLSAYYDGEVTSPWKEKIEEHIAGCAECRRVIEGFQVQSVFLSSEPEPAIATSYGDIQKLIRHKENTNRNIFDFSSLRTPLFPVAAAAAAVLAFFIGFGISGSRGPSASFTDMPLAVSDGWSVPPGDLMIRGEDIEAMLSAINQPDSSLFSQEASLTLPGDLSLAFHGDPQLLRSASFTGGSSR